MMEKRLIDANALMKHFATSQALVNDRDMLYCNGVLDVISREPSVDAVKVVHGRWEWYEDWVPSTWLEPPDLDKAGWKCSNCRIDLGDYLTDCLGVNVYVDEEDKMPKIKSCPNCGAKMDAKDMDVPTKDGGADNV